MLPPVLPHVEPKAIPAEYAGHFRLEMNASSTFVHSLHTWRHILELVRHLRHESRLSPRIRELATLQVGYLLKCDYEVSHHIKVALESGVSAEEINAIASAQVEGNSLFEPAAARESPRRR